MKNTRLLKTFALVFAFTLVLSIAIGWGVSAEDSAEVLNPTIIAKNIYYTDKTAVQLAVDAATVDEGDVSVVYTFKGEEKTLTEYVSKSITLDGKSHRFSYLRPRVSVLQT